MPDGMKTFSNLSETPALQAALVLTATLALALLVRLLLFRVVLGLSRRTRSGIDDSLVMALRNPVFITILLVGIGWGTLSFTLASGLRFAVSGAIKTLIALIWTGTALKVGDIFLEAMSRNQDRLAWIQPKTLPILRIAWKVLVIGALAYALMIAWHINPTSWLASAGVMGLAIGFAAKDTLANLFAGIFIIADAPYQIGDFVVLKNGVRGVVTDIGMRSSRILTRDDVEVTVPNAIIANAEIINESGGRHQKMRVRVRISVAYGSDIDRVRGILLACARDVPHVVETPAPRVRLREFGDSGLLFELLTWIEEPIYRGLVLDELNTRVYKAFGEAGIEIPYAKQDVYVRQLPPTGGNATG
jgi:MscS family membrane protein